MNNLTPYSQRDINTMLFTLGGSTIFFFGFFCLIKWYFDFSSRNPKGNQTFWLMKYRQMSDEKRSDFVSRINSQIHAILACILGFNAAFLTW
jgi:hypothetical protein